MRTGTQIFLRNLSKSLYGTATVSGIALWDSYFKMSSEIPASTQADQCHCCLLPRSFNHTFLYLKFQTSILASAAEQVGLSNLVGSQKTGFPASALI